MKTLNLLKNYFSFNLKANMEYRTAFFIQVFGMFLNNSAFIIFWKILYIQIGSAINGYAFNDMMFLWAISALGFGLSVVLLGNGNQISRIIYSGGLDIYILQPKPILPNLLASRMHISGWGDVIYGIILYSFTQPFSMYKIGLFIFFSILICFLITAVRVFYHSFTFFLGNADSFAQNASDTVLMLMMYPGSIFTGPERLFLHSLIPAVFLTHIPVELFKDFNIKRFLFLLAGDIVITMTAIITFKLGLKKYESGNLIGTRL